ncbi:hypothetical protein AV654_24525 [Paenibacillus elgii]|uniref:Uncharacterized protein n=1 Tax=Paenibacillus elgii TaxID=189691 RepID=A0A161S8V9_9BACL|nr:hypothetical protein AV654_24525 [Paenibacillus elgii]
MKGLPIKNSRRASGRESSFAYKYIQGVGYQWAGKYAIQRTVQSYPELRYMQTENECGDGLNDEAFLAFRCSGFVAHRVKRSVGRKRVWLCSAEWTKKR